MLAFVKPIIPLSIIAIYCNYSRDVNFWIPISMCIMLVTDVLAYINFVKYYMPVSIGLILFYIINIFLLKDFITIKDIKSGVSKSPPVIISIVLIGYLIFFIVDVVLPKMVFSIGLFVLVLVSLFLFVVISFFIYAADRYEKTVYLFIVAYCVLFANAVFIINELYYYDKLFIVLINVSDALGYYLFAGFFIETKLKRLS
ncbi:hypothetical protein [Aquimarina pacifica]|uniref:hypothetical protein n=1 Tax=Aquimarina pacifica TaxID=1296415 RepID=UPI001377668A|nr:hypothetical protein [Aquimarina pacifica]